MSPPCTLAPVVAVVYSDGGAVARILERAAAALHDAGHVCAGFIQRDEPRPQRTRCDMILVDLASGTRVQISEDRGPGARGCHLDPHMLLSAMEIARSTLCDDTSVLVLNKFGKCEAEGGGFRPLICDALERSVPILIGVPWRNIESWREFAGELGLEVHVDSVGETAGRHLLQLLGLSSQPRQDFATSVSARSNSRAALSPRPQASGPR